MPDQEINLGIVGLGYVGLPLAVEFAKIRSVIGFDIKSSRIDELRLGIDKTLEVEPQEFEDAKHIQFTANIDDLKDCRDRAQSFGIVRSCRLRIVSWRLRGRTSAKWSSSLSVATWTPSRTSLLTAWKRIPH